MKILKIPTYWTAEEADSIYQCLGELRTMIWQAYGKDIQQWYAELHQQQTENEERGEFNDDLPF